MTNAVSYHDALYDHALALLIQFDLEDGIMTKWNRKLKETLYDMYFISWAYDSWSSEVYDQAVATQRKLTEFTESGSPLVDEATDVVASMMAKLESGVFDQFLRFDGPLSRSRDS